MQKKIRTAQQQKIPFMVIAGDADVEAGTVSFRYRDGSQRNGVRWPRRSRTWSRWSAPGSIRAVRPVTGMLPARPAAWRLAGRWCGSQRDGAASAAGRRVRTVGVADELERLWTPHRMAYITGEDRPERTTIGIPLPPARSAVAPGMAEDGQPGGRQGESRSSRCSTSTRTTLGTCSSVRTGMSPTTPTWTTDETSSWRGSPRRRCECPAGQRRPRVQPRA